MKNKIQNTDSFELEQAVEIYEEIYPPFLTTLF